MKTLNIAEINVVAGGEVGATGMGDDYHYTGNMPDSAPWVPSDCDKGCIPSCPWPFKFVELTN